MNWKNLKKRIARRKKILVVFAIVVVITIVVWTIAVLNGLGGLKEVTAMFVSAFISTAIAIYVTKEDILDNDYAEKRDDFGILTFEKGYREVFRNEDSETYLKSNDWEQFFNRAKKDKEIYFVGISFYAFFDDIKMREVLYHLCMEQSYNIYIILANPFDREILRVSEVEEKTEIEELKIRILKTYKLFEHDLKKDRYKAAKERIHIWFSIAFPSTLLIKSGEYMIASPYILENPDRAPTFIIEASKSFSLYEKYDEYLNMIKKHHYSFDELRTTILTKEFFTQSYTNLSPEFYSDLDNCEYLAIVGLGQSRMLRTLSERYVNLLKRGGKIDIILTDPDGESTKMCTRRSSKNRDDISSDIVIHKEAINRLLDMREIENKKGGNCNIRIYVSDFMYPYTIYAFNCEKGVNDRTRMYVWQTVLFEPSEKRPGFLCEGKGDFELMLSYYKQFKMLKDECNLTREITTKYQIINKDGGVVDNG